MSPQLIIGFPISIAVMLLQAASAVAQARASDTMAGRVAGQVSDSTGRPLEGARVALVLVRPPDAPADMYVSPRLGNTDSAGRFIFDSIPPGRYAIRVTTGWLGRHLDTITVQRGRLTTWSVRMRQDIAARLYHERQHLVRASWQPTLSFTDDPSDVPPCIGEVGLRRATVTLSADTIVVTGCEIFPEGWPNLVGRASRYGMDIILDLARVDDGQMGNVVFARQFRAKIMVPDRARYAVHVRFNIMSDTLESEVVTSQTVDLVEHTVGPTE